MALTSILVAIILLLGAALVVALVQTLRLREERQWLRRELLRTLRVGAGSVEAQAAELVWRQAAMEAADTGLIVTDQTKAVMAVNSAATAIFGEVPAGTSAIVALRHHTLEQLLNEALSGGRPGPALVTLEGRELRAEAAVWPKEGRVQGVVLGVRDITAQQHLARARRDFIANIGHELRTPLSSLKLLIETLQRGGLESPTYGQRLVAKLGSETEAMIRLVEDMTALALIESGRTPLRLAPAPLAELVASRVARLAPLAELRSIRVIQQVPPGVSALLDEERFGQVLTNLLDNALKFTPEGGTVTIRAGQSAETIRLEVEDSGHGISPSDLPRIFERFYKSDAARDRSAAGDRGTGLGLAIAKHLVEAHAGRIWAESPPGRGAVFIIELPAEPVPTPA
ncbi:MAG: cell wall metabolism sensor histidine kinase WalK [Ardenticatenaceae bacterium]|nr:cell wall metabolism sensor histidine kinase WalK [Ardenticatenaceae bacterium]